MKKYPADNCLCTVCTQNGHIPMGSPQSRTVRAQHLKSQKARDAAGSERTLEERTLLATLSVKEDSQGEDPLWRGWKGGLDESQTGLHGIDSRDDANYLDGAPNLHFREVIHNLKMKITEFLRPRELLFTFPPNAPSDVYPGQGLWTSGPTSILREAKSNAQILLFLEFLKETERTLRAVELSCDNQTDIQKGITLIGEEFTKLETFRQNEWERFRRSVPDPETIRVPEALTDRPPIWYNTDVYFQPLKTERPVIVLGLFIVMVLNLFHHLVRSGCTLALHFLKAFMQLSFQETLGPDLPPRVKRLVDRFPVDLQTARKLFELEPTVTNYVCCPECFALYPVVDSMPKDDCTLKSEVATCAGPNPQFATKPHENEFSWTHELPFCDYDFKEKTSQAGNLPYPSECSHRPTRDSPPCGTRLVRGSSSASRPLRMYSHQSLKAWLARLISRPGMEQSMDAIWDRVRNGTDRSSMSDIWDATELREFRGPDKKFFHENPRNEGRYIFSLFVDWFNPLGNKQAGKVVSSGVIFMVCLNLPLHVRYKRENVYLVGLMPGPKSPRLQQVNHFLQVLVDELLEFWDPGVFFSRTTLWPSGRLIRCAVVPLICDLGAIKKVSGQASHSATYFCTFCKLKLHHINNVDSTQWPPRLFQEHLLHANEWKNAHNPKDQDKAFKRAGVRFTPLLDLPYWDPIRYVVIEAMHNLFLGLFHRHCRRILGMNIKGVAEDGLDDEEVIIASEEDKERGRKMLFSGKSANQLKTGLTKLTLQALYEEVLSSPCETRTKAQLIKGLMDKVSGQQTQEEELPTAKKPKPTAILDKIVLAEIQEDIAKTTLPSWIGRAPSNIGSPGHGKLSADQWRTLCTIHLPITLTRIWTQPGIPKSRTDMLINFLNLVIAVLYGTPRQLTEKHIQIYEYHIFQYVHGLFEVFPGITLVPNQHYALHLPTILRRFGPTHAYWAFPFERYIGLLSDINTNRKSSEMEKTFMQTYCMGSNLRSLLSTNFLPPVIQTLRGVVDTAIGCDSRGSLMSDLMVFGAETEPTLEYEERKKTALPPSYYDALLRRLSMDASLGDGVSFIDINQRVSGRQVYLSPDHQNLKEVRHRGLRFSPHWVPTGKGDALVLYKPFYTSEAGLAMGRIESIFVHRRATRAESPRDQVFVAIRRFSGLEICDQSSDPYQQFKHLRMSLVYTTPHEDVDVLPIVDVVAHFASCPFEDRTLTRPCMVTVPLLR